MTQHSLSNSVLNIILVLAESAITLVLRFDPNLRRAVYPLAQKNTTVSIRTYLPHVQFYATFTTKGILLDSKLGPDYRETDVVINTYTHQLLNALVSSDVLQINKLTMRGNTQTVAEVRLFLVQLGLASLFQGLIKTFKNKTGTKTHDKPPTRPDSSEYKARIEEQQQQLNTLSIRNRELEMSLKEAHSKQKALLIALIVMTVVAIGAIIGWIAS